MVQSSIGSAAFVGIDGLTVSVDTLDLAINRNLSTEGDAIPRRLRETILELETDLTVGKLVFGLGAQQAAVALVAGRSTTRSRPIFARDSEISSRRRVSRQEI